MNFLFLVKGLCLAFLGLLCKFFPEHMRKYSDPLLIGQYLKYLHEHVCRESFIRHKIRVISYDEDW
jgi:hypothetical protein